MARIASPHRRHRRLAALAAVSALALGASCPDDNKIVGPSVITALSVSPVTPTIALGDSVQLVAVGTDSNHVLFIGVATDWSSSDSGVARVTGEGLVHGLAVGTATITATAQGFTAMSTVTVEAQPAIALSTTTVTINTIAGGPDPGPDSVLITNGGGTTLDLLVVDSIVYGAGAANWLTATLGAPSAPTAVTLNAQITGLAPGSYTATVWVSSAEATNSPQSFTVTLVAGVDAAANATITAGNNQSSTVNTAVAVAPTVHVTDQYGNNVPGVQVVFAVTAGGGSTAGATDTTDANGIAAVGSWTLGTATGANTLSATVTGLTPVIFNATGTAGAPNAAQSSVAATGPITACAASCTVPGSTQSRVDVTVRDQFGNPVSGVTVTLAATGSNNTLTQPAVATNASGVTSGALSSTLAQAKNISATAGAVPVTTPAVLTVNPDTVALGNSTFTAATGSITACAASCVAGATGSSVTATLLDQFGNAVPGLTVTFASSGTANTFTPAGGTSNASGQVAALFASTKAEAKTLSATVTGPGQIPATPAVTVVNATASAMAVNDGDNQSAEVLNPVPTAPSVFVADAFGNPVAGVAVNFAVASGGGSVGGANPNSDAAGVARVGSWTLGSSSGANSLNATSAGLNTVTFNATAFAGGADSMFLVQGDAQTDTVAHTLTVTYQVKVVDTLGNGVPNVPVSWAVPGGEGSINPPLVNTDVNGIATAARTLGTVAGAQSATAAVGGLNGSPVTFSATAVPDAPTQISANSSTNQSATVNTNVGAAPSVLVRDQFGNATNGVSVTFTVGGGGTINPASPATLFTDASGIATLTSWTLATTTGANTVQAASGGLTGSPVGFSATGTPDAVTAAQSTVATSDDSIVACNAGCSGAGNSLATLTVTARDQFGNAVPGVSASLTVNGSSNAWNGIAVTTVNGTTNGAGQFSADLTSTVAQLKTVSSVADGVGVTQTAGVTVGPATASLSNSLLSNSTSPVTACSVSCVVGSTASTVTATIRDAFSNVIAGATVTLSATGTSNAFSPAASGATNGSGVYSATFSSTTAQAKTLSATVTAVGTLTTQPAITVNPAAPATVTVTNAGLSVRVGTGQITRPTYTVRDAFSNLVPNFGVSYSSFNSGAFSGPASTDAFGQVTLTSWTMSGVAADDGLGRMANQVSVTAGAASGTATDYGIYTWSSDVGPMIGPLSGCQGCHYQSWDRNPNNIVGFGDQNPVGYTSCSGYFLVQAGNANNSLIYLKTAGTLVGGAPPCGGAMPSSSGGDAASRKIIRAWINNGALNN